MYVFTIRLNLITVFLKSEYVFCIFFSNKPVMNASQIHKESVMVENSPKDFPGSTSSHDDDVHTVDGSPFKK